MHLFYIMVHTLNQGSEGINYGTDSCDYEKANSDKVLNLGTNSHNAILLTTDTTVVTAGQ